MVEGADTPKGNQDANISTSINANPSEANEEEAKQPDDADNGFRRMNDTTQPAFRFFHRQRQQNKVIRERFTA